MTGERSFSVPLTIVLGLLVLVSMLVSMPAFPATYTVDPTGNDGGAGDSANPWRTVQHAAGVVVPGDIVAINAGTYTESVYLNHSGVADAPIVFSASPGAVLVSPNPSASLSAFDIAMGTGFVELAGIEATGGFDETIFLRSGTHDITISGCNLHGNRAGIIMGGASNITVDHCSLHDNLILGIRFAAGTHDVQVSDTDSFRNGNPTSPVCSSSVDGFAAEPDTHALTFTRVRSYQNTGDGFDLQADAVTLNDVTSSGNACTGIKLYQNVTVRGCLVFANARGVAVTSVAGGSLADIAQCTVAANTGLALDLTKAKIPDVTYAVSLRNSILVSPGKGVQYVKAAVLSEDHNIFFRPGLYDGGVIAQVGGYRFSDHDINVGRWTQLSQQGQGTIAVDPQFVDPASGNFQVAPTSDAVGRGAPIDGASVSLNIGLYQQPAGPTNNSPWADAGRDLRGRVFRKFNVNATGSFDPDGDPLSYSWDFGDGSAPTLGFTATHIYLAPGRYAVTLTVSDGTLASQATIHATVH